MVNVNTVEAPVEADGRRARRDRNRYAVVDAYLDLIRGGNPEPSIAEVAERSGVSHRSVFRYFSDKDELIRTAVERQDAFIRPLLALDADLEAPLDERIAALVERRLELFASIAPVARVSRTIVHSQPVIADGLTLIRAILRQQIEKLFAAELDGMDGRTRTLTLAGLDVLCSFESVELLRYDVHLDREATAGVLAHGLNVLLTGYITAASA